MPPNVASAVSFWDGSRGYFAAPIAAADRAAVMYSLIVTAKMNDIDSQASLADVLARIAEHPVQGLDELLPWNWRGPKQQVHQAA
jgi:transposase